MNEEPEIASHFESFCMLLLALFVWALEGFPPFGGAP